MNDCCKDHLKSSKLSIKYNNTGLNVSRKDLIENWINRKLDDSDSICAYMISTNTVRDSLGTYYRPFTKCIYQDHDSSKVVNKPTYSKKAGAYSQLSYLKTIFPEIQSIIGVSYVWSTLKLLTSRLKMRKRVLIWMTRWSLNLMYKPMKLFFFEEQKESP